MSDDVVFLCDGSRLELSVATSSLPNEAERTTAPQGVVKMEKVVNAWGSAAGAGSDFFDLYRRTRTHEILRLEQMDKDWKAKIEHEDFLIKREKRRLSIENATAVSRDRRRRRRERAKEHIKQKRTNAQTPEPDTNTQVHSSEPLRQKRGPQTPASAQTPTKDSPAAQAAAAFVAAAAAAAANPLDKGLALIAKKAKEDAEKSAQNEENLKEPVVNESVEESADLEGWRMKPNHITVLCDEW